MSNEATIDVEIEVFSVNGEEWRIIDADPKAGANAPYSVILNGSGDLCEQTMAETVVLDRAAKTLWVGDRAERQQFAEALLLVLEALRPSDPTEPSAAPEPIADGWIDPTTPRPTAEAAAAALASDRLQAHEDGSLVVVDMLGANIADDGCCATFREWRLAPPDELQVYIPRGTPQIEALKRLHKLAEIFADNWPAIMATHDFLTK